MIKSVSITPVWEEWKKFEVKQVTGFSISIDCGIKDADEILNLIKEMIGRQYSTESEEREDDD